MCKFTIILPVRNGANHIEECIESILSQSCVDFELIILENASTDNTLAIIQKFKDNRISVLKSTRPLSIEQNWARILSVDKSEFITLIGHDDVLDSNYLQVINDLILQFPQATLYQTHFRYIDIKGALVRKCKPMKEILNPQDVVTSFLSNTMDLMGTGFMMRSNDYHKISGIPPYPNLLFADMQLFIELSNLGSLVVSPQECFSYRIHKRATTSTSSNAAFLKAFDNLVHFLYRLKSENPHLQTAISSESERLLNQYCQAISHKILKTSKKNRQTPNVKEVIELFREYGKMLESKNTYEPLNNNSVKLGSIIDQNFLLHQMFLLFKKIYDKPIFS